MIPPDRSRTGQIQGCSRKMHDTDHCGLPAPPLLTPGIQGVNNDGNGVSDKGESGSK